MRKRLAQVGNSLALVIDKPILELIGIDATTELDMTYDGQKLIVTPIRATQPENDAFRKSVAETIEKHRKTFQKLSKSPSNK
jgi:antitoxin component of MazEF toxin-antitoxin module